ncbi:MAG: hypothetical protein E2576_11245 [Alcaligenaceae bacterium]|nr:hypothetical protein [Alcaligenaceae bacterium SAGV5]MPT57286.1 hypothetical protein [Alcaligenaceae bacterium]
MKCPEDGKRGVSRKARVRVGGGLGGSVNGGARRRLAGGAGQWRAGRRAVGAGAAGGQHGRDLGPDFRQAVLQHVVVHFLPAGEDGGLGHVRIERIAVFQRAAGLAAGAAYGPPFGVLPGFDLRDGLQPQVVAAGRRQQHARGQQPAPCAQREADGRDGGRAGEEGSRTHAPFIGCRTAEL